MKNTFVYAAVAVAAALGGFLLYSWYARSGPSSGTLSAALEATGTIPQTLPDFTLLDRTGAPRSIRSWPDRSMIVNFWATWCAPCRREIPLLKQIQRAHGEDGFQVVGVAVDFRDDVMAYADDIGIDYPLLIGEEDGLEAVHAFGISAVGFPFTVFTDVQGRIVTLHLGELTAPQSEVILAAVRGVNRGELTVAEARTRVAEGLAAMGNEHG